MSLVILDRDGVINKDSEAYIKSAAEWQPIAGSIDAICRLQSAGFTVAVASNQSGVARGLFSASALDAIDAKMQDTIAAAGGSNIKTFYCQHGPDAACSCRKPAPGLLIKVSTYYQESLKDAVFVGDSPRDIEAAEAAGCTPILLRTGNGAHAERRLTLSAAQVFDDLAAFAHQWCQR